MFASLLSDKKYSSQHRAKIIFLQNFMNVL
jgi:hypothetical protein